MHTLDISTYQAKLHQHASHGAYHYRCEGYNLWSFMQVFFTLKLHAEGDLIDMGEMTLVDKEMETPYYNGVMFP